MGRIRPPEFCLFPVLPRNLRQTQAREWIEELGLLRRVIVGARSRTAFGRAVKLITASSLTVSPNTLFRIVGNLNELSSNLNLSLAHDRRATELRHSIRRSGESACFVLRLCSEEHPRFPGQLFCSAHGNRKALLHLVSASGLLWLPSTADKGRMEGVDPLTAREALDLAEPITDPATT